MRRLSTCIVLPVVLACAQSDRLAQETIPTWSVASEPMVVIGGDADPAGAFYRVGGATRLGAGYLIANSSEHELRLYAADGRLLRELGREGPGPGEFRGPRLVARLPNDSVAIFDGGNRRLSIVCDGARVCGEWVVPPPGNVIGIDGDFLLLEDVQGDAIEGASFDRHTYLGFRRNATEAVTLFALDGVARLTRRLEGRLVSMPVPGWYRCRCPFRRDLS